MDIGKVVANVELTEYAREWLMFKKRRQVAPRSGDVGTLVLMDADMLISDEIAALLEDTPGQYFLELDRKPVLFMKNEFYSHYVLGSGWIFKHGLDQKRTSQAISESPLSFRYLTMEYEERAITIISLEYTEDILFCKTVEELHDGRRSSYRCSFVDKNTGHLTPAFEGFDWKSCNMCILRGESCFCDGVELAQQFRHTRERRREHMPLDKKIGGSVFCGNAYCKSWIGGWAMYSTGSLPPIQTNRTFMDSGETFELACLLAAQDAIASVLTPRAAISASEQAYLPMPAHLRRGQERDVDQGMSSRSSNDNACGICGASFSRQYELRRHVTGVHYKRRNHGCPVCGKGFSQKGHLNEHLRLSHQGDRGHTCSVCKKKFASQSKVLRHVRAVHENVSQFMCGLCGKKYKEKSYLKLHRQLMHEEQEGPPRTSMTITGFLEEKVDPAEGCGAAASSNAGPSDERNQS
mmetsp:Transcript_7608/g.23067  ORF Transcript_7608/g.23067 Transcript_7608/m.23067 type:complete len:465 (-) Transcript_7608:118-1512(-)|eukprot:CAMPEP_0198726118 /NCGR_PEP_ID=MMETSP1475-20131203/3279_1 /TAXON_ID= ORGANISM="Unidentified sp., Strain CCMP1999" /NCGR_SAMPLE_ID=MMETSP1475 /ASSEMBLY_ACC=CAM_ASM_001111 /LENGTH=464 /DNA_ID=CAMNT_0044488011 /DNA_START=178 /DNA_END=1572 /DNA_ORIENTATION=+